MADRQGWITLESAIDDYLIRSSQSKTSKYNRLFHIAFGCMESLGLDFFYQIKSTLLTVNANKVVSLPNDFRKYTKLGVLNANGQLYPLQYNEGLTNLSDLSPNRLADTTTSNFVNYYSYSSPTFFNFWNGTSYYNMYGINTTGIYGGGFKIDSTNGVILLDGLFDWNGLVLEYIANPADDQDYYIPSEFRETIIAWLSWQDIAHTPSSRKGSLGDKRDRRHEYFEARRLGIRQYHPFYLDQAYIESQQSSKLVVKS